METNVSTFIPLLLEMFEVLPLPFFFFPSTWLIRVMVIVPHFNSCNKGDIVQKLYSRVGN